jgi:hypothetical protein
MATIRSIVAGSIATSEPAHYVRKFGHCQSTPSSSAFSSMPSPRIRLRSQSPRWGSWRKRVGNSIGNCDENGRVTRPSGPDASMTLSSPKTGLWRARLNEPGRTSYAPSRPSNRNMHAGIRKKRRPLQLDSLAIVGVASANDLVGKAAVGIQVVEVSAAAKEQRILQRLLEMPVRALNGAILVCDAQVIPGRYHVVMAHQSLIAQRQILLQVAECRREAVAAMLARRPAERPQRILQTRRQRDEALAAEHDMGMLEAREREPKVV